MPGRDGTGPQGAGPGTGGRRGPCFTDAPTAGRADDVRGSGRGYGPQGGGRGRALGGRRWPVTGDTVQGLMNRAAFLEQELAQLRVKIETCKKNSD